MKLYNGDCLEVLKTLPENSIDSVITDPPYGLSSKQPNIAEVMKHWVEGTEYDHKVAGFMGKEWDSFVPGPNVWKEVYRVMKPGAIGLIFAGTRMFDLMSISLRFAGFEIRDCLMWVYGSGFPKSYDISKGIDKHFGAEREVIGTKKGQGNIPNDRGKWRLKENTDVEITNPFTEEAKIWNGWGTALKPAWELIIMAMKPIDSSYVNNSQKHGVAGLNIDDSRINDVRFPTNLILDEKSGKMLDEQSGILKSGYMEEVTTEKKNDVYGKFNHANINPTIGDMGGASRFFYCAKASPAERNAGVNNTHPTVKPLELMKYLCTLTKTPTGGNVLDPFMGSGTTGMACVVTERDFIGIDDDVESYKIAKKRISNIRKEKDSSENFQLKVNKNKEKVFFKGKKEVKKMKTVALNIKAK